MKRVDWVLRFVFVALVPPILAVMNALVPVESIVITAGIATLIALFGARQFAARVEGVRFVGKLLAGFAKIGTYYDEHPPRPLVYYLVYPLLLPYWVFDRVARAEFLLYRKLNAAALVITLASRALDYFRNWYPVIPFRLFVVESLVVLVFQLVITMVIVMPIVTTVVIYARERHRKTLWSLFVASTLMGIAGIVAIHHRQPVTAAASMRLRVRTAIAEREFHACVAGGKTPHDCVFERKDMLALIHAIEAAQHVLATDHEALTDAETTAHDALEAYYRPDEADAFHVHVAGAVILLATRPVARIPAIWVARDRATGRFVHEAQELPPALLAQVTK